MHKRKEALDLSGTNGSVRKLKLQGASMATFSKVPYLITVSNCDGGRIPPEMLQKK
jgi:hypothetical protein